MKSLKKLLASASTIAIATLASNAMAADYTTNAALSNLNAAVEWHGGQPTSGAVNNLILGAAHDILLNGGGDFEFNQLQLAGNGGQTLTVSDGNKYQFASILPGGGGATVNVAFAAAGTLTIDDTNNGLDNVDFGNQAGFLVISKGDIQGLVGDAGNATVAFKGQSTIHSPLNVKTVIFSGDSNIVISKNITADISFGKAGGKRAINLEDQTIVGKIDFSGANANIRIRNGVITGQITNAFNASVSVDGKATITGNIIGLGTLNVTAGNTAILAGANSFFISATTGTGTIATTAASTLVGNFGATTGGNRLAALTLRDDTTLGNAGNGANIVATVFDGNQNVTISEHSEINATNIHNNLNVSNGIKLTLNATTLNAASTLQGGGASGTVITKGAVVFGDAAVGGNALALLDVQGGTLETGGANAFVVTDTHVGGGAVVTLGHNLTSNLTFQANGGAVNLAGNTLAGDVDFANNAGTLSINGGTVTGNVDSVGGANGTVKLNGGDGTITGKFGATKAASIQFVGDRTLNIGGNVVKINSTTNANGEGTLALTNAGAVTLSGNIGKSATKLNKLEWADERSLTLGDANIYVNTLDNTGHTTLASNKFIVDGAVTLGMTNAGNTEGIRVIINNNKTLTVSSGTFDVNALIDGNGPGEGTLLITGAVTTNGVIGGGNKLALVHVDGANGHLTTAAEMTATDFHVGGAGQITLGDDATGDLTFQANGGTVNLAGKTLTGNVDFNGNAGVVSIDGGGITGAFQNAGTGTIKWLSGNLTKNIADNANHLGTLEVAQVGNVASNTKSIYAKNVIVKANTFTLAANDELNSANGVSIDAGATFVSSSTKLDAKVAGNGTFNLKAIPTGANFSIDGNLALTIGAALDLNRDFHANTIKFSESSKIVAGGDVMAKTIEIEAGKTLSHNAGDLAVTGSIFGAGTFISEVEGPLQQIGSAGNALAVLELRGAGIAHEVLGQHYATNTNLASKSILELNGHSKVHGNLNVQDAAGVDSGILDLDQYTLTLTGNLVPTGKSLEVKTNITGSASYGKVEAASSKLKDINLTLNLSSNYTLADGAKLQIFNNVDGAAFASVSGGSGFNKFKYQDDGSVIFSFDEAAAGKAAQGIISFLPDKTMQSAIIELFGDLDRTTGEANIFATQLGNLDFAVPEQKQLATSAITRALTDVTATTGEVNSANVSSAISMLSNSSTASLSLPASVAAAGTSAGDEDGLYRHGIWTQGFGSKATQKLAKGRAGYKSTSFGGVVGVDSLVSDYLRVGVAGIHSDANIKMRDQKAGDKVTAKSWLMSVYGVYEIDQNWYSRAIATFGNTNVKTRESKPLPVVGAKASYSNGKYSSQSYSVDVAAGYRHALSDNIALTPEVGLRASMFNDGGYTETGGSTNRTITKRAGTNYAAIAGATLSTHMLAGEADWTNSIHAKVLQDIGGKIPEVSSKMNGALTGITTKSKPISKTSFQAGVDTLVKYGMMEYGLGYEATISKKFLAHSGALKVRVNF